MQRVTSAASAVTLSPRKPPTARPSTSTPMTAAAGQTPRLPALLGCGLWLRIGFTVVAVMVLQLLYSDIWVAAALTVGLLSMIVAELARYRQGGVAGAGRCEDWWMSRRLRGLRLLLPML